MKKSNRPSARTMRRSVAYARLAAKAHKAGNHHQWMAYSDKALKLREQAYRQQDREDEAERQRAEGAKRFRSLDDGPLSK